MVSVLASSAVVRGFKPRSGQTKARSIKEKDDNASEWGEKCILGLLFQ